MSRRKIDILIFTCLLLIIGFIFFHIFFHIEDKFKTHNLGFELISAVLGTTFTVAVMAVILKWQYEEEQMKEYKSRIFASKLKIYQELLALIFELDDDRIIEEKEILKLENKIGEACLIAGEPLVSMLSQFLLQLKLYGRLYFRNMDEDQLSHFVNYFKTHKELLSSENLRKRSLKPELLDKKTASKFFITLDDIVQSMREDLNVVEKDVRKLIEHFVTVSFNEFGLIRPIKTETKEN